MGGVTGAPCLHDTSLGGAVKRIMLLVGACGLLSLAGCGSNGLALGLASPSYSNDHTTAAGGFGLGPEDYNTNGGAFGPESVER